MSCESHDKQAHDVCYQSLREVLIPMSTWFRKVQQFESILNLTFTDTGGEDSVWRSASYAVPYTYTHPIYAEMLHERHPKDNMLDIREINNFTPRDMHEWTARLKERLEPYGVGAVSDELVTELDSDNDIGIIVHKTGGTIYPFRYSEVRDFEFEMVPVQTVYLLAQYARAHTKSRALYSALTDMIEMCGPLDKRREYYMYYQPVSKAGVRSENVGTFTWRDSISLTDTHDLTKYMRTMFAAHAKCFVVP